MMPQQKAAVRVEGVTKKFGTRKAVDSLSFELPQGAFLSIFGPNGAGKTTLLRMLATLAKPSSGSIAIAGSDAREEPDAVRARIGMVSHHALVYPDLTAIENLEFYAKLYGVPDPNARAMELLEAVELKTRRFDAAKTFSRGMMQRLAIARALVNEPEIILLDEPYSGLDPHAAQVLDHLLDGLRSSHTFMMVSHDLAKGYEQCSHVLLMEKGKLVEFASKEDLPFDSFKQRYMATVGVA